MIRPKIARLIAAAALAAVTTQAGAQTATVRFMLDFAVQGQQSPFILAAEAGHFARAGVNVQVDRGYGSADAIVKVASGAYDMAFADIGALIQFNATQKVKLVSVLQIYDVAPMAILSLKQSNIKSPVDLAGKRMASPPASASRTMFPVFARTNGLDPSSVVWIDVTPQLREMLLVQRQADATTAFISDVPGVERLGVSDSDLSIMRFSDFGVSLYGNCVLTTPEFIARNAEAVKRVVKAAAQSWKLAIADPDSAIAAIKKRDPLIDEKVERRRLDLIIRNALLTEHVRREGLSAVEPDRLKQTIEMVADTFKIPAVDPASVYRADLLPAREELRMVDER
jgi:NitT/TauT family transport system substrate-binding protein